jgi:hypothetical protein
MQIEADTAETVAIVAAEVRASMARLNVRPFEIIDSLDMGRPTFSRKYNGHVPFTLPELIRISRALDIPLAEIVAPADRISPLANA